MIRFLRTTAIVLAITAGIYSLADYLVGLWRPHHLNVTLTDGKAVPAYRNQPYVSEAFIREKALEPGEWQQVVGQRLVTPPEYHGSFSTSMNWRRRRISTGGQSTRRPTASRSA